MAFKMNYTDTAGRENSDSYWLVTAVQVEPQKKTGFVIFTGFSSQQAFESIPNVDSIGTKTYFLSPDNWDVALGAMQLDLNILLQPCYRLAALDPDGFFASASQV